MHLSKNKDDWNKLKEGYLCHLLEERLVAYLDPGAEEILSKINSLEKVVTTSSCVGRITVIEARYPWERREESRIVFKTHRYVSLYEIAQVIVRPFENLWLKVTGPIIHIRVKDLECAQALLDLARKKGFKHSGAIAFDEKRPSCCTVEINSPTQLISPLKLDGVILVNGIKLKKLVKISNEILDEGRARLRILVNSVDSIRSACSFIQERK